MELSEIISWNEFQQPEIFYNNITETFFLKDCKDLYFYSDNQWEIKFHLGSYAEKKFKNACLSVDYALLCYKIIDSEIVSAI